MQATVIGSVPVWGWWILGVTALAVTVAAGLIAITSGLRNDVSKNFWSRKRP